MDVEVFRLDDAPGELLELHLVLAEVGLRPEGGGAEAGRRGNGGEGGDIWVVGGLRHDEQVHGCLGGDVAERQAVLAFVDLGAGDFSAQDLGEDVVGIVGGHDGSGDVAFSNEVGTGSREENASEQESRAPVLIQSEPEKP